MNPWILPISIAYLLGSIPFGYLLVRIFKKEDIREKGSGNIGATNVARSGAKGLGLATLLLDLGKAYAGVAIAEHLVPGNFDVAVGAAVAAVVGHVFPVWLGFRGGKGVASALGVFLALTWPSAVGILLVFAVVFALTRYVSLASIASAASFPLFGFYFVQARTPMVVFGFLFIPLLVIAKHHENIRRLLNGTESKFGGAGSGSGSGSGSRPRRAWGTALAISLARRGGHTITLWSHSATVAEQLAETGENLAYLPGYTLPVDVVVTADLPAAIFEAEMVLCVTPSQHLRGVLGDIAPLLTREQMVVSATKGLEEESLLRMTQVIGSLTENACGVLSGPSFAAEVAAGIPTAMVAAAAAPGIALTIQKEFSSPTLRLYTNDDVAGVELGGALKNVIALAAGVVHGLNLGHNAGAALVTRGIAEITRLAVACGGRRQTLAGLSGLGDLVLTCTGSLSRNRAVGIELGKGRHLPEILAAMNGKVAEGIRSTTAALGLAARYEVEMPITEQMDAILHRGKSPKEAIRELMMRPGRDE